MYMDVHPVTNEQYNEYLAVSGYTPPVSDQNWLKHWPDGPSSGPPAGWANKPVTWVSRNDASAYCNFFGKRLPHTWEYQWAAQGQLTDESLYFPTSANNTTASSSGGSGGGVHSYYYKRQTRRRQLDEAPPPPPPGDYPWCRTGLPCTDDPDRYPPRASE